MAVEYTVGYKETDSMGTQYFSEDTPHAALWVLSDTPTECVTQCATVPRVARCLKRLLLSSPLTLMSVCGHTCAYKKVTFRLHHARDL